MEDDVDLARPVIFLTAKVQAADYRRFIELGIRGVIAKPFDPLTLGKQVREIVNEEGDRQSRSRIHPIRDGMNAMPHGMNATRDRMNAMRDGMNAMRDGMNATRDRMNAMRDGMNAMRDGVNAMRDGINPIRDGMNLKPA